MLRSSKEKKLAPKEAKRVIFAADSKSDIGGLVLRGRAGLVSAKKFKKLVFIDIASDYYYHN